jgi:hypothetical protein
LAINFLFQDCCNQLQPAGNSGRGSSATLAAVPAHLKTCDHNVKAAVTLDLTFQAIEQSALEFCNLAASQASHVDVVPLRPALIVMLLALHVHEIKFVHQTMSLKETKSAVNGDAINVWINPARVTQNLAGVEMLFGGLDHAQDGPALVCHAQAA